MTDTSGTITDTYFYTAFGEELAKTGTTENEFRYVGEQWDPNAGFYYLRARWYDQSTGRFASVDPYAGDPQAPVSLHRYLYCGMNPIAYTDASGKRFDLRSLMFTVAIWGNIIAQSAKRIIPWLSRGNRFVPTLPYLQRLANATVTGETVQVMTKLTQSPQATRQLSCAIGENAEALCNAARTTGTIYRANIPKELFEAPINIQWATRSTTMMGDVIGTEIAFSANAMKLIIKFFY